MKTIAFNRDLARKGAKVVTHDGHPVTIITLDNPTPYPIVAYYTNDAGEVRVNIWPASGTLEEEIGSTQPDLRIVKPARFTGRLIEGTLEDSLVIQDDGIDTLRIDILRGRKPKEDLEFILEALNMRDDAHNELATPKRTSIRFKSKSDDSDGYKIEELERVVDHKTREIGELREELYKTQKELAHYKDFAERKTKAAETAEHIVIDAGKKITELEAWKASAIDQLSKWGEFTSLVQTKYISGLDLRIGDDILTKLTEWMRNFPPVRR